MALPSTVPRKVADVIMRAMQPDVAERVPSAFELRRMLQAVMVSHVSAEDVAGTLREYLKDRMQARRQAIADALRDAAARAALTSGPGSPGRADVSPMRASLPSLPPEAAPLLSPSAVLIPRDSPERAEPGAALAPTGHGTEPPEAPVRLRPLHVVWLALATLVTLGVWSTVVVLALQARSEVAEPHPDEHTAPAPR